MTVCALCTTYDSWQFHYAVHYIREQILKFSIEQLCFTLLSKFWMFDWSGTVHLKRQHFLGGERSKTCQIRTLIVIKTANSSGVRVKNQKNLPMSLMDVPSAAVVIAWKKCRKSKFCSTVLHNWDKYWLGNWTWTGLVFFVMPDMKFQSWMDCNA